MTKLPTKQCLAFVLSNNKFGDDSAFVTMVGENGLFSVLAKGVYKAKSSLKPLLISGNLVKLEYKEGKDDFYLATSLLLIEDNSELLLDYQSSCFLFFLQELSLSLFKYGDSYPYEQIYRILKKAKDKGDLLGLSLLTIGTFFKIMGIDVNTKECVCCGKSHDIVSYDLNLGGFICKDCLKNSGIIQKDEMLLHVLRYSFKPIDDFVLNKKVPKSEGIYVLKDLVDYLVSYFSLNQIKSLSMLLQAIEGN